MSREIQMHPRKNHIRGVKKIKEVSVERDTKAGYKGRWISPSRYHWQRPGSS